MMVTSGTIPGMATHVFCLPRPVDLAVTLAPLRVGRADPTTRLAAGEAWRATCTPDGPATLRLRASGRRVEARAWGPGSDRVLAAAPALVGGEDTAEGFATDDPLVGRLARRLPGLRLGRTPTVLEVLVPTVLGQRVAGAEQTAAWTRLVRRHGRAAPGPGQLLLPPSPDVLASLPSFRYHPLGVERRRAETIRRVCDRAVRVEETRTMPRAEAVRRLTAFAGVGPWTAATVARHAFGDADAVEPGDYNLPHLVAWNLAGEARGDDARMLELLAPFRGHRGRVVCLLKAGGRRPPRFGPRRPLRNLAAI